MEVYRFMRRILQQALDQRFATVGGQFEIWFA